MSQFTLRPAGPSEAQTRALACIDRGWALAARAQEEVGRLQATTPPPRAKMY